MKISKHFLMISLACLCLACSHDPNYKENFSNIKLLTTAQSRLTDVIVHDIFSPPVASRIYAYPAIAAYEAAILGDEEYVSFMGQLNGFEKKDFPIDEDYFHPLASIVAYYQVAIELVFSEDELIQHMEKDLSSFKKALPSNVYKKSYAVGEAVASHIMSWTRTDNYHQSRSFEKYTIKDDLGTWKPTPPAYMEGIEPHWNKIRTMVIDSSNQFVPLPPTKFDTTRESQFYKEAYEVFAAKEALDQERKEIALFWDCNPYKMNVKGHVMYAEKKITPGGHWQEIASIAAKTADLDWKQTTEALALTSIALFDAFISCWDEKYRSALIRPETYINMYIDENWLPLLQTPPFPEHTSGHSVISTAASEALTQLLGEPFHFVDSTEVKFGLPIREFNSFREAAEEAAISRFYGGIHFMPAIVSGVEEGKKLSEYLLSNMNTRPKESMASTKE